MTVLTPSFLFTIEKVGKESKRITTLHPQIACAPKGAVDDLQPCVGGPSDECLTGVSPGVHWVRSQDSQTPAYTTEETSKHETKPKNSIVGFLSPTLVCYIIFSAGDRRTFTELRGRIDNYNVKL